MDTLTYDPPYFEAFGPLLSVLLFWFLSGSQVTALNPYIGYDNAAAAAKKASLDSNKHSGVNS